MSFIPISLDDYVKIQLKSNLNVIEKNFRSRLETSLDAFENGIKCECGNDIWVVGSASAGYLALLALPERIIQQVTMKLILQLIKLIKRADDI